MTEPTAGFIGALLNIVLASRPRFDGTVGQLWSSLTSDLSEEEAAALPLGLARLTPLFVGNPDYLGLLVAMLVQFEVFEAADTLTDLAEQRNDPTLVLAAASLAAHPGSDPRLLKRMLRPPSWSALSEADRRNVSIRTDPTAEATSDFEGILRAQSWPGAVRNLPPWLPPFVGVDDDSGTARDRWRALSVLEQNGLMVRRVSERPAPVGWLPPGAPILTWDGDALERLRRSVGSVNAADLVVVPADLRNDRSVRTLQRGLRLRLPHWTPRHTLGTVSARSDGNGWPGPLSPDVYHSGALDAADMGILGGGGRRALYDAKNELPPTLLHTRHYWSFNQLVALRTWQYFRSQTGTGRLSRSLLTQLSQFAGADDPSLLGVTATGHVLSQDANGYADIETGQRFLGQVVALDEVFQPFRLGDGQVPSLLQPSAHTRVHPGTLGGTPSIAGHRIGVRTVASLAQENSLEDIARIYYPEVPREHLADAVNLGRQLLAA